MKILYIATNFTAITHTFITREVGQLQQSGHTVDLLSVRTHLDQIGVTSAECNLENTTQIYPVSALQIIKGLFTCGVSKPGSMFKASTIILGSTKDSLKTKLKLFYQLAVSTVYAKQVETENYDRIHAHFANSPTTFALFLNLLTGVPFSFTGHAVDIFREKTALQAKLIHAADVVSISQYNHDHYNTLVPNLETVRVHCGLNLEGHPFNHRQKPNSPLRILSVGRSVPKKGFKYLLSALKLVTDAGVEWQCDIAGGGPLEEELRQQANENDLTNLTLHGPLQQSEIKTLLNKADLFVLPCIVADDNDRDNIPVSLMEAMANGCPVISTDVAGIPELIGSNNEFGLMTIQRDPKSIADAIIELSTNHSLYSNISSKGRERIENEFDVQKSATQLIEAWQKHLS